MFQPSELLFTQVKQRIQSFLHKYGLKNNRIRSKEFDEALDRYTELVNDYSFQHKLLELQHLETVIAQVYCMNNIDPRFVVVPAVNNGKLVSARNPYPRIRKKVGMLSVSLGPADQYNTTNVKKLATDAEAVRTAKSMLLDKMNDEFMYDIYKLRFKDNV